MIKYVISRNSVGRAESDVSLVSADAGQYGEINKR